jgi:hypothetical protein
MQANGDNPVESIAPKAAGAAVTLAVDLAVPERLHKGNLHPYRLIVKGLRNVLQMAPSAETQFADDLTKVKDAIGEWHDWEELLSIAQKELDHGSRCGLVAELKKITGQKYDQALALSRSLRRTYLRSSHPREPVWDAIAKLVA